MKFFDKERAAVSEGVTAVADNQKLMLIIATSAVVLAAVAIVIAVRK